MIPSRPVVTIRENPVYQRGLVIDSQHVRDHKVSDSSISKGIGD